MNRMTVSSSPHIRSSIRTDRIMLDVLIALLPSAIAGVVIFGIKALLVLAVTTLTAVLSEFLFNLIVKKEQTINDLSAAVTGLILGLNLHANAPVWQCVIGAVFAIIVVKCLFGGLGSNFANPAATARIFLFLSFASLGGGAVPKLTSNPELVSGATPLESLESGLGLPSILEMLLGARGGAIGETCIFAILAGFIYLVVRGVIKFETPIIFVGTVFLLSLLFSNDLIYSVYQILSGGLMFGAVFMATDYVTTPCSISISF